MRLLIIIAAIICAVIAFLVTAFSIRDTSWPPWFLAAFVLFLVDYALERLGYGGYPARTNRTPT